MTNQSQIEDTPDGSKLATFAEQAMSTFLSRNVSRGYDNVDSRSGPTFEAQSLVAGFDSASGSDNDFIGAPAY